LNVVIRTRYNRIMWTITYFYSGTFGYDRQCMVPFLAMFLQLRLVSDFPCFSHTDPNTYWIHFF